MIPNTLQFNLIDSQNNPLTGSLVTLRPLFSSGSYSTAPQQTFADINGTASFYNVLSTIFEYSYTAAGANSASFVNSNYIAYEPTVGYINVPDITGSIIAFDYIINFVNNGNPLTGSSGSFFGNESQLGVDIPQMTNTIREYLNDWALQENGACFIAEDNTEKINIGFNNCVGPRVLIIFTGELPDGENSELTGRVRRNYDVIVQRGKILNEPRNSALTTTNGSAKPFYALVEGAREVVRSIIFPQNCVYNPPIYQGIMPAAQSGWLMDSYIISFSILMAIPRIQSAPPQLGVNEWVNLTMPLQFNLPNSSP